MYRVFSVTLTCRLTGISIGKYLSTFLQIEYNTTPLEVFQFVLGHMYAYPTTIQSSEAGLSSFSQRYYTQKLSYFMNLAFRDTKKIFIVPLHQQITIYDDLIVKRSAGNRVKTIHM